MKKTIVQQLLPEIKWISDDHLKACVINTYLHALQLGKWEPEDMKRIPFTLLLPNCPYSYLDHVRGVVHVAKTAMDSMNAVYSADNTALFMLNSDILLAGALLHDVGKLTEYTLSADGTFVKSDYGKNLRHPFSGTALALQCGCPAEIAHIIAAHAKEGDMVERSPEAIIVSKADFMNFETVLAFSKTSNS